jgi:hypothetical protein
MIVTMRLGIEPKCNVHHIGMTLRKAGELNGWTMKAYLCDAKNCIEAYNSSFGYFDLIRTSAASKLE